MFDAYLDQDYYNPQFDMHLIVDSLYLGNFRASSSLELLKEKRITHVLVVGRHLGQFFPDDITYHQIYIEDKEDVDISLYFQQAIIFISQHINNKKVVFVHCAAGISRSASMVIAYLIYKRNISFEEAYTICKNGRPFISPNLRFVDELKKFAARMKKVGKENVFTHK